MLAHPVRVHTGAAVKPIKLKVKVSYTVGGAAKVEMISVGPEHLGGRSEG